MGYLLHYKITKNIGENANSQSIKIHQNSHCTATFGKGKFLCTFQHYNCCIEYCYTVNICILTTQALYK